MQGLTPTQDKLLRYLEEREGRVSPTYQEMADAIGLKARSGIHRLIDGLEERGYVTRLPKRARTVQVVKK